MATYRIRASRTGVHIEGFDTATKGSGQDTGKGYVAYSPYSHCPSLTRAGYAMAVVSVGVRNETGDVELRREFDSPQGVYDAALSFARSHGGSRVCARCTRAAVHAGVTVTKTCRHCGREVTQLDGGSWVLATATLDRPPAEWTASFACYGNMQPCPRSHREPLPHSADCPKCQGAGDIPTQHEPAVT